MLKVTAVLAAAVFSGLCTPSGATPEEVWTPASRPPQPCVTSKTIIEDAAPGDRPQLDTTPIVVKPGDLRYTSPKTASLVDPNVVASIPSWPSFLQSSHSNPRTHFAASYDGATAVKPSPDSPGSWNSTGAVVEILKSSPAK